MIKHGMWKSKEWNSWQHMRRRCYDEHHCKYSDYGGRGIKVCDEWNDPKNGFYRFFLDMGFAPSTKHTIDREDVNGDYCKDNCRWSTPKKQGNNKRNNRWITYCGETKTLTEWAESLGIKRNLISNRMASGMDFLTSITVPLKTNFTGENNNTSLFTDKQRRSIYMFYKSGMSKTEIMKLFDSKWSTINSIIKKQASVASKAL